MNLTAQIWIDLATSDLQSSRLLHDSGHFRTSYFLFQQATEKANKAFALLADIIKEDELKKFSHNTINIYKETSKKQAKEINALVKILEQHPNNSEHKIFAKTNFIKYHETLSQGVSFMNNLWNYDLVKISLSDLNFFLRELKKVRTTKIKIPNTYEKKFDKIMLGIADWAGQFGTEDAINTKKEYLSLIANRDQAKEYCDLIVNQLFPMVIDIAFVNLTLYFCAVITVQHSSLTRYPEKGKNPELIYTKRLPLIQKQKQFMDLLEDSLVRFKNLNKR
ncbi:MAG: HEPN domain-containing protein [Bacteroidia bacterium]